MNLWLTRWTLIPEVEGGSGGHRETRSARNGTVRSGRVPGRGAQPDVRKAKMWRSKPPYHRKRAVRPTLYGISRNASLHSHKPTCLADNRKWSQEDYFSVASAAREGEDKTTVGSRGRGGAGRGRAGGPRSDPAAGYGSRRPVPAHSRRRRSGDMSASVSRAGVPGCATITKTVGRNFSGTD